MARPRAERDSRRAVRPRAGARGARDRGGRVLTARRAGTLAAALLLACYVATLAPGVTFWDAGEFIAAAHGFGIPHPPGTPLYVALAHVWMRAAGALLGEARAMNLLSALATACAGGVTARLVARETRGVATRGDAAWGALAGALCAGLMTTAWANATETEVYAIALLHVTVMLACAARVADDVEGRASRWLLCSAYVVALAPAVHLSALVASPAAVVLAARDRAGRWRIARATLLGGVAAAAAGVGRMSLSLVMIGVLVIVASVALSSQRAGERSAGDYVAPLGVAALAASALLVMLVRAWHDPAINQGNPATLSALATVVARRQYDVAGLFPRRAPVWLQLANVAQYLDWQIALDWGRGIFTSPLRVTTTVAYLSLAAAGARAMYRDAARFAVALLVLALCGTLGVAAYLNLKAGASLGWGLLPDGTPHEARERDYFFVLGFWAWGCFAGYGALTVVRRYRWPTPLSLAVAVVPLVGNWRGADRSRAPESTAARDVAVALLGAAPPRAVLFTAGDNDTYPLWYAQQVEGMRGDVLLVTMPLLPADWYPAELARRTGWGWNDDELVPRAAWREEQRAFLVARAARATGRPIAATPALTAAERAWLGSRWTLRGVVYESGAAPDGTVGAARLDTASALGWLGRAPTEIVRDDRPDDVTSDMLALIACPRLVLPLDRRGRGLDSLEVKCNLR